MGPAAPGGAADLASRVICRWDVVADGNELLACPRCGAHPLLAGAAAFSCPQCGAAYPILDGIPCLVDDPSLWRALWASRLDDFIAVVEKRVYFTREEAERADQLAHTRQRLARQVAGLEHQKDRVASLLRPLTAGAIALPSRREEREKLPIMECYEHIFRDWAWGAREVDQLRALVEPALPQGAGAIAIYGAGAGRLAADIHESRRPRRTYALDINPLPVAVAAALTRGETVDLPELPVAPRTEQDIVVDHHLRATADRHPGLYWLFADGLRPPFAPQALDAVVTSWFIDVVAADVRVTAAAINRVLRPGGLWLNVGPLRFRGSLAQQYQIDEVHDLVSASAFALRSSSQCDVPYFDSPHSGSRRIETVFAFCAEKVGEAVPSSVPAPAAPWVRDPRLPIPVSPPLVAIATTSVFTASMLGLVDGTRSMVDLAEALGHNWQIEPAAVLDQLRAFFAKLPE